MWMSSEQIWIKTKMNMLYVWKKGHKENCLKKLARQNKMRQASKRNTLIKQTSQLLNNRRNCGGKDQDLEK